MKDFDLNGDGAIDEDELEANRLRLAEFTHPHGYVSKDSYKDEL